MSGSNDNLPAAPWFVPSIPWPWSHGGPKKTVTVGNPQHLLNPDSARLGFQIGFVGSIGGSGPTGAQAGAFPANVGSVLNLSSAAIASAPAFLNRPNDQG